MIRKLSKKEIQSKLETLVELETMTEASIENWYDAILELYITDPKTNTGARAIMYNEDYDEFVIVDKKKNPISIIGERKKCGIM